MKELYYYEHTDDGGVTWFLGEPSFSLIGCVDKARRFSYPYRVLKVQLNDTDEAEFIYREQLKEVELTLEALDKIFK